jgi:hypothetical protein
VTSNLPEPQDATPALLGGQAALFDDPRLILQWDDAFLRSVAANIGKEGGSILAQLRRAAGLVAWAAWHRFDDKTCEAFLRGIADNLGVSVRTVREWRKVVIDKETLPIPALAAARSDEALKRNTPAGQGRRITTPSTKPDPIPVDSTETADLSSGGAGIQPAPPVAPTDGVALDGTPSLSAPPGPPEYGTHIDDTTDVHVDVDAIGLRWLQSKTTQEVRAIGDPWGPAIRAEVKRWAEAIGFTEPKRPGLSVAKLVQAGSTGPVPVPSPRYDLKPPPRNGAKRHALDCSCLGCKPAKAVAK